MGKTKKEIHKEANTVWWVKYSAYLKSYEWSKIREFILNDRSGRCERCESTTILQVHHKTYKNVFNEQMDDLELLCLICHKKHHAKEVKPKKQKKHKVKKLKKKKSIIVSYNLSKKDKELSDRYKSLGVRTKIDSEFQGVIKQKWKRKKKKRKKHK